MFVHADTIHDTHATVARFIGYISAGNQQRGLEDVYHAFVAVLLSW